MGWSSKYPRKWTNVTWRGTIWKGQFIFQPSIFQGDMLVLRGGIWLPQKVHNQKGVPWNSLLHFKCCQIHCNNWCQQKTDSLEISNLLLGDTFPETNSSHLKIGHPKRKYHLPTIHFQVRTASFREGTTWTKFVAWLYRLQVLARLCGACRTSRCLGESGKYAHGTSTLSRDGAQDCSLPKVICIHIIYNIYYIHHLLGITFTRGYNK